MPCHVESKLVLLLTFLAVILIQSVWNDDVNCLQMYF